MNLHIQDKVFVVSGGAKGIGAGIAESLSSEGAIPVIIGRNEIENNLLVEKLKSMGFMADCVTAELSNAGECKRAIDLIRMKYPAIHGLVNNAGLNDGVGLENGDDEKFIASINRNVTHYFLLAHYLLPQLINSRGSIVNIGSKVAETGQGNTSGYAAANGARNALTREWAVELLKYHIRVNSVIVAECYTPQYESWIENQPNPVEKLKLITEKIPLGKRMTTPREIADMVVFLLSPLSSHTTGQLIYVDGGYTHLDRGL
jgi:L-fucose dehydrogenase